MQLIGKFKFINEFWKTNESPECYEISRSFLKRILKDDTTPKSASPRNEQHAARKDNDII